MDSVWRQVGGNHRCHSSEVAMFIHSSNAKFFQTIHILDVHKALDQMWLLLPDVFMVGESPEVQTSARVHHD